MQNERIAFFVLESQRNDKEEFQALIAVEGMKGYYTTDWFWGTDFATAEAVADARNDRMGISIIEAFKIIASTMSPNAKRLGLLLPP
jgi:hypothetical protein